MTENKKGLILIGLLAVAGGVWYADTQGTTIIGPGRSLEGPYRPIQMDSLALRADKLERSRRTEYKPSGRDLFSEALTPVAPKPTIVPDQPFVPQGPPMPTPPEPAKLPANVKYFGYGTVPNGTSKRAFLSNGEEPPIIVSEGDLLLGKYRVLKIGNATLEFEDTSTGLTGTAPLEEQAAPPA